MIATDGKHSRDATRAREGFYVKCEALGGVPSSLLVGECGARRGAVKVPLRGSLVLGPVGPSLTARRVARGYAARRGWARWAAARSRIMRR